MRRFEARHRYFKRLGNLVNIALTLATRHQQLQCYSLNNSQIEEEDLEIGLGEQITADSVTLGNLNIPSKTKLYKFIVIFS